MDCFFSKIVPRATTTPSSKFPSRLQPYSSLQPDSGGYYCLPIMDYFPKILIWFLPFELLLLQACWITYRQYILYDLFDFHISNTSFLDVRIRSISLYPFGSSIPISDCLLLCTSKFELPSSSSSYIFDSGGCDNLRPVHQHIFDTFQRVDSNYPASSIPS